MGTNYYFIIRDTKFAHEHFATKSDYNDYYYDGEYEICENPDLHFAIHLNKCSAGWKPLFQIHREWDTFAKLEKFYMQYKQYIDIEDEYGRGYTWDEYKADMVEHTTYYEPEPKKWVYGVSDFDRKFATNPKPHLHLVECEPEEAEIWTPFDHIEYARTEKEAAVRLGVWERWMDSGDFYDHADPDYQFDWSKGEFS